MVDIEWEDPPEVALARVRTPGKYVEWAFALREHPGRWAVLPDGGEPRSEKGASNTAQNIRRGQTAGFKPKGTYEAVSDGPKVWVRYNPPEESPEGQDGPELEDKKASPQHTADPSVVRSWARTNGLNVPSRGRIPEEVWDAYGRALERGERGLSVRLVGGGGEAEE